MDGQNAPENTGEDIVRQQIAAATSSMLPLASGSIYRTAWHDLQDYRTQLNLTGPTTIRHVFSFLAKKYQDKVWTSPGTLWTRYSMLRNMIRIREGTLVDDGAIMACESWLKGLSRVHNPKQSFQLTKEQVARFLIETQDKYSIDLRLLLVFGVNIGLRTADLKKLQWKNVSRYADGLRISIDWATKTDQGARGNWYFIAKEQDSRVCGVALFEEYRRIVEEVDPNYLSGDLWLKIVKTKAGKWSVISVRGRNWITSIPSIVAKELGLQDPEQYTGHCFRRTSAQWQADAGATTLELQNQFGWKSQAMAVVYTGQSTAARSASSKRCLLSGDIPFEAKSNLVHESTEEQQPTSARQSECSATTMRPQPPQSEAISGHANIPWPLNISGQNVNIYFGCAPSTPAVQQDSPTPNEPVPPRVQKATNTEPSEKDVCSQSDIGSALLNLSDLESICSADMANSFAEVNAVGVDDGQMSNAETPVVTQKQGEKRRMKAARKVVKKKKPVAKPVIQSKAKSTKATGEKLESEGSSVNAAVTNPITGRPQRIVKTTIHNNPYSKNTKGYVAPNA
jgi:integrase